METEYKNIQQKTIHMGLTYEKRKWSKRVIEVVDQLHVSARSFQPDNPPHYFITTCLAQSAQATLTPM
jgi:hypothetical protein